jgi:two-component system, response regulator YesN
MKSTDRKKLKIAVIDDSDFSRSQIINILTDNGFTVCGEASSADDGLRIVAEKKPHLAITDIVMPNISGIELTDKIVKNFPHTAVILISSLKHEQIVLEGISKGAIDYISKPIDPLQLVESVEKYCSTILSEL